MEVSCVDNIVSVIASFFVIGSVGFSLLLVENCDVAGVEGSSLVIGDELSFAIGNSLVTGVENSMVVGFVDTSLGVESSIVIDVGTTFEIGVVEMSFSIGVASFVIVFVGVFPIGVGAIVCVIAGAETVGGRIGVDVCDFVDKDGVGVGVVVVGV